MQGLYEGYQNLIHRILGKKAATTLGTTSPPSVSGLGTGDGGIVLAQSASQRFERLSDRLQLLILSEAREFLAEKEALISTVNISSLTSQI